MAQGNLKHGQMINGVQSVGTCHWTLNGVRELDLTMCNFHTESRLPVGPVCEEYRAKCPAPDSDNLQN